MPEDVRTQPDNPPVPATQARSGVMGKVKDGVPASKAPKTPKAGPSGGSTRNRLLQFVANLGRTSLYKPMQGWYARIYTAVGLGVIVVLGLWRLYETVRDAPPA